jgi:hypothetical protein
MAEQRCPALLEGVTEHGLDKLLAHRGLARLRSAVHCQRYLWQSRLFLLNSDRSRHCAAARYVAGRLAIAVTVRGTLAICELDENAVGDFRYAWDPFLVGDDVTFAADFFESVRALRASYASVAPPPRSEKVNVIALPRRDPRSRTVSATLRDAGVFDQGAHLSFLCARQSAQQDVMDLARERSPAPRALDLAEDGRD